MKRLLILSMTIIIAFFLSCKKENNNINNINSSTELIYGTYDGKIIKINDDSTVKNTLVSTGFNSIISAPINKKFVYTRTSSENSEDNVVYLYDLNSNTSTKIIESDMNYVYTGISISHSGNKVLLKVYDKNSIDLSQNLVIIDANGTNLQTITTNQDVHENVAVFSPDDSKIAFYSNDHYLYSININGTNLKELDSMATYASEFGLYINWNSDGSKLAYISKNINNTFNLSTIDANGNNKMNLLSNSAGIIQDPVWYSDNSKLIFSNENATGSLGNIFTISATGNNSANLINNTTDGKWCISPENSGDNNKISYVEYSEVSGISHGNLYVLNISSNTKLHIASDLGYPYKAFWIK